MAGHEVLSHHRGTILGECLARALVHVKYCTFSIAHGDGSIDIFCPVEVVHSVLFLIYFTSSINKPAQDVAVGINAAIAQERPPAAHLLRAREADRDHLARFLILRCPVEELSLRANHH